MLGLPSTITPTSTVISSAVNSLGAAGAATYRCWHLLLPTSPPMPPNWMWGVELLQPIPGIIVDNRRLEGLGGVGRPVLDLLDVITLFCQRCWVTLILRIACIPVRMSESWNMENCDDLQLVDLGVIEQQDTLFCSSFRSVFRGPTYIHDSVFSSSHLLLRFFFIF